MSSRDCRPRSSISEAATSAASDTCTSARLVSDARASASLASRRARLPPKTSGSQLASKPAWKRLLASAEPERLRWAEPEALSEGPLFACCTSRWARACSSAACALRTPGLACSAWVTRVVSEGSLKRCHHWVSVVAAIPSAAGAAVHWGGTTGSAPLLSA